MLEISCNEREKIVDFLAVHKNYDFHFAEVNWRMALGFFFH